MKTIKPTQLFFLLTLFTSACKKNATKEDTTASYLTGIVKHKYTKAPIPGLEVTIEEVRPGILGSDHTLWDKTITESNGEFTLKLQKTNPNYQYKVQTLLPGTFDTTKITYQFMPDETYLSSAQLTNQLNIELEPAGRIATAIQIGKWDSIPADSIILTSPYATEHLKRGNDRVYFYVDPSKLSQFSWCCVKNGVKGNTTTKQIYVPNYYKGNGTASVLFYKLTF